MSEMKGIVAEGGRAGTVLVGGNKISVTVAKAESYLNKFAMDLLQFFGLMAVAMR